MNKKEREKQSIAAKAKTILSSTPDGIKIGELRARLREEFPEARVGTINSAAGSLVKRFPDEICEPAFGWRCHTKFTKSPPGRGAGNGGSEEQGEVTPKQRSKLAKILFDATPKDGKRISNGAALQKVQKVAKTRLKLMVSKEMYFDIRNELIANGELGKGLGYGGSVYRVEATTPAVKAAKTKKPLESALYPPIHEYLEQTWAAENGIKRFVVDRTANLGGKKTRGTWTRPDLSLVAVHTFPYIPGKTIELVTFEVKPANNFGIEGVFETAAHSRAAHRSYLMVHTPDGKRDCDNEKFERLTDECERFRLGLIIFNKPDDWETFETVLEAERRNPDPADVNAFIRDVMHKSRERISEMVH